MLPSSSITFSRRTRRARPIAMYGTAYPLQARGGGGPDRPALKPAAVIRARHLHPARGARLAGCAHSTCPRCPGCHLPSAEIATEFAAAVRAPIRREGCRRQRRTLGRSPLPRAREEDQPISASWRRGARRSGRGRSPLRRGLSEAAIRGDPRPGPLQRQVEELKMPDDLGAVSQDDLANLLRSRFPGDRIERVPRGGEGADAVRWSGSRPDRRDRRRKAVTPWRATSPSRSKS
jgi:hypothetical protein